MYPPQQIKSHSCTIIGTYVPSGSRHIRPIQAEANEGLIIAVTENPADPEQSSGEPAGVY